MAPRTKAPLRRATARKTPVISQSSAISIGLVVMLVGAIGTFLYDKGKFDGRLAALEASNGKLIPQTQSNADRLTALENNLASRMTSLEAQLQQMERASRMQTDKTNSSNERLAAIETKLDVVMNSLGISGGNRK